MRWTQLWRQNGKFPYSQSQVMKGEQTFFLSFLDN